MRRDYSSLGPCWSEVFNMISRCRLIEAVEKANEIAVEYPKLNLGELNRIKEEYRLMLQYVSTGFRDPSRESMQKHFQRRMYRAMANARVMYNRLDSSLLGSMAKTRNGRVFTHDSIRRELEDFVAMKAMFGLEGAVLPRSKDHVYWEHQEFMKDLFSKIVVSTQWNEADRDFYTSLLLSPTVELIDALLLVSAISLATWQEFDCDKFDVLLSIYENATNEALRQRALVGWGFGTSNFSYIFTKTLNRVKKLCERKEVMKELIDMQKQVIYCLDAERDGNTIRNSIMPTLLRNNELSIDRYGRVVEREEDSLEDILNPEAADKRMEELEESIQKMVNMQKAGADVYYEGFAQMKRSSFFFEVSNWFCPFFEEHPDIERDVKKMGKTKIVKLLMSKTPLCDSDKYSFLQAMSSVLDKLPQSIREAMETDIPIDDEMVIPGTDRPEYIRRFYLQDLYRFFQLFYDKKTFCSPFEDPDFFFLITEAIGSAYAKESPLEMSSILLDRDKRNTITRLLYFCNRLESTAAVFTRGFIEYEFNGEVDTTLECMRKVLEAEPDNEKAMLYMARSSFDLEKYALAVEYYRRLYEKRPERKSYALNYGIALTKAGQIEESLKILYEFNYKNADDKNCMRALAWTLMLSKRLEQAELLYSKLGDSTDNDRLNHGYCRWLSGDISGAVKLFRQLGGMLTLSSLYDEFDDDSQLLELYGIPESDRLLMADLVLDEG